MSAPVQATRQFKADFDLVCRHYKCTPAEIEEMKICARKDMTAAGESFAHNALIIRGECDGKYKEVTV